VTDRMLAMFKRKPDLPTSEEVEAEVESK